MPENNRGIGSEGLEQGGPNLGNDYARADLSTREAGNALTSPDTSSMSDNDRDKDSMDRDALSADSDTGKSMGTDADDMDDDDDLDDDLEDDEDLVDDDDDDKDDDVV